MTETYRLKLEDAIWRAENAHSLPAESEFRATVLGQVRQRSVAEMRAQVAPSHRPEWWDK